MRADYDSQANAIQISLVDAATADRAEKIGEPLAAVVAIADNVAVAVDLLCPDLGIEVPLREAAERNGLDAEELIAAAQAALAAPDRVVTVAVGIRAAA